MANPYTTQTIANFNSNPPPDDGTKVEANRVTWAKIINKAVNPVKVLVQSVNAEILTAFGVVDDRLEGVNYLDNGKMQVAQRGVSFTATTGASGTGTDYNNDIPNIVLDRWKLLGEATDIVDVTQETTLTPDGSGFAMKFEVERLDAVKFGIIQIVDSKRSAQLAGSNCSLRFDARVDDSLGPDHLRAAIISYNGTADAMGASEPITSYATAQSNINFSLATDYTYENSPASLATLATTYQTFKIENIGINATGAQDVPQNVCVMIWSDDHTATIDSTLYISNVSLQKGEAALFPEPISLADDLHNCRHFFRSTFDNGVAPAVNLGLGGAVQVAAPGANDVVFGIHFDPPMRSATMETTVYNPGAANNFMRNVSDGGDLGAITATDLGEAGMVFTATLAGGDVNDRIAMHYVASVDI